MIGLILFMTTVFSVAANVNVTTKYGKTGGIVGPLNTTSDKINGRSICSNNPTAGCDFADDPQFDNHNTVNDPTDDTYAGDLLVRTNDNFQAIAGWTWNGVAGGADEVATITGTLPETNGAHYYEWTELPGSCNPANSSISTDKQTIICERKDFDKNNAGTFSEDVTFNVRVLGGTPSGTQPGDITFKVEAPNAVAKEDTTDGNSLTVTASPRWNLDKSFGAYAIRSGQTVTLNGVEKTGWIIDYRILIETDEVNGEIDNTFSLLGNESLGEDATITFKDELSQVSPNATLLECRTTGRAYSDGGGTLRDGYVGSNLPISFAGPGSIRESQADSHIPQLKDVQTPTCTQTGSTIDVQIEHVDATLNHYPTKDYYNRDLPVNRAIASILIVSVFIPLDDVKAGVNGTVDCNGFGIGDNSCDDGELPTKNIATDFNPVSASGNQNFAGQGESEKDNYRNYTLYYSSGNFDKYYWGDKNSVWNGPSGQTITRQGDRFVGKGYEWSSRLYSSNTGGIDQTEDSFCDVIDANYMEIIKYSEKTNYTDTRYSHEDELPFILYTGITQGSPDNHMYGGGTITDYYDVEYAADYEDSSFLPSNNGDRQDNNMDAKIKAECNAPATKWYPTIDAARAAQGGVGAVTKVRWKLKPNMVMVPGQTDYWMLLHRVRENRLDNNQSLHSGAMMVNYGTHKFDGNQGTWSTTGYIPHGLDANGLPETTSGTHGDRMFFTGPKVRIKKHESRTSASPGDEVIYTLEMSLTDDVNSNGLKEQVTITDVLPKDFKYKQGSISPADFGEPAIGTCADVADITSAASPCVDGENQVLVWDLGQRDVNAPGIPDLNYTALIGAAANVGTNTNAVKIEAPTDASPVSQRKAEIGLTIDIPASINIVKSTEENPAYPSKRERTTTPKDVFFLMDMRNGKSGDITDLDVIDILPFAGDGDDGAIKFNDLELKRAEPTAYHGTMVFHEASFGQHPSSSTTCDMTTNGGVKYYYTNVDPKTINMAPTVGNENDINNATSIWCQGNASGPNGCTTPSGFTFTDNSEVTAVRARGPRMEQQAICQFRVHVTVDDNLMSDNYSNSAGASATGITLPVLSNSLAVPIVGSSLGDYVWYDQNKDGIQDANEQGIAGVRVHLLDASGNPVNDPTTGQPYIVDTNATGGYSFEKLNHGDYKVQFELPNGYAVSPKDSGGDDALDSDATKDAGNPTATTEVISLGVDTNLPIVDLGLNTPVISGHIFDDGDGDDNVTTTTPINTPDGVQLYATLLDENGAVLASTPIAADGTYSFDGADGVRANTKYKVVLSTVQGATTSTLPANWNNTGQQPSNTGVNGNDGNVSDGMIVEINVGTTDVPDNDFGINKKPEAVNKNKPSEMNPGGSTQVSVPTLEKHDLEDGNEVPTKIKITELPTNATLYYNGLLVTAGQIIDNYDPTKLMLDPNDGELTAVFKYTVFDKDGQESDSATVTMPFTGVTLSGHVFDDGSGDANINGTLINKPDGTQLYATLLNSNGNMMASVPVDNTGAYAFTGADGVTANTEYTISLGTTQGTIGDPAPAVNLPANWNNADGEQPDNNGTGNDGQTNGAGDGKMTLTTGNTATNSNNDFGINHKPISNDTSEASQLNPGGATQVQVPDLNVTDTEDGKPTTITIKDLPANATLYYDGQPVVAGTPILHFDPIKLTVDPIDGDQTVIFNYTTTDAAGVESDPATVTMPFTGLSISGNIFNDGDGDADVNGTTISAPDGTQLHATLLDANGVVLATTPIAADGSYSFDGADGVAPNTSYSVVLATSPSATTSDLPANWNNTGENVNSVGAGNDGTADGMLAVNVGTANVPQVDFGINHKPVASDVTESSQLNPGGTTQVQVPDLNVTDTEDGQPTTITIKDLPANATLYYDGQPVVAGTPILHFDPIKLTVDPIDGDQTVIFNYTTTDAAGVESDPATVTMPFTGLGISGNIFNDGDGDADVDASTGTISSPDGIQLYATLLADDNTTIVATTPIAADGTYSFDGTDGVTANTNYTIVLATSANATTPNLPTNWNNTGENVNSAGAGNDGMVDGAISVSIDTVVVPQVDFGINKKPVATDVNKPIQNNPGGNIQVPVPHLDISDNEDGTPTTVTIKTLPTSGTLYYNGTPVTVGQVIPDFDPSKLTVDPNNGNVVIMFNYTTTDGAGIESDPAKVTMPFNGNGIIKGNVSAQDANGNLKPIANVTLILFDQNGNEVARTTTDAQGNYIFSAPPGNYYIQEAQPNGYYDVSENEGGADNESINKLLNTINVTVGVGETDVLNDFIESTTKVGCNCAPTPVIPCTICTHGSYSIHAHNVKDHTAEVHWVDSYYEIAYDIYLNGKFIATVPEDTTRYTFKNLQSGTEYTAVIIANNGYGGKTRQTVTFTTTDGLGWLPAVYHMLSN